MAAFDPRVFAGSLTQRPGAYQMIDGKGRVIYVGKARNLRRRVASYFGGRPHDAKTMAMVARVADIRVTVTATEADALMLEYNLIKRHKPRFNVVLRDDKSYPYIRVRTDREFPQVSFYRGSRRAAGRLFGPYPSAGSVRATLGQLQKLFQVRQCEDSYFSHRQRPCLQFQIQRCTAPCVGLVSAEEYRRDIDHAMMFLQGRSEAVTEVLVRRMEDASERLDFERAAQYRDQIARLKSVEAQQLVTRSRGDLDAIGLVSDGGVHCVAVMSFRGGRLLGSRSHYPRAVAGTTPEEIMRGFLLQYYGRREPPHEILVSHAASDADALAELFRARARRRVQIKHRVRGDRRAWIGMVLTNAAHAAAARKKSGTVIGRQFRALANSLELNEIPRRLACFDVSHTSGESTVASCVVFGSEGPLKSEYRRFNIAGVTGGDDYAALTQALGRWGRRLTGAEAGVPEVLMIDGGRGQLGAAAAAVDELRSGGMRLVAVAKGPGRHPGRERLYLEGRKSPLKLPADSPALYLVQQLRDEAHRFAIAGHRARRHKRRTASPLEGIPGVGPKRRRDLLRQFGGLHAVTRAGVEDLARVKGISRRLAKLIYEHVHSD
ncbi:MAG: excinuclease ABC subunit UvrC [Rhodospirillaceae bacterium]|nr:excinuclease ABC subunit UvrC [Rhodospirillaceae bacterium]MDE0362651.1 excinuclease ABC subunit UvrC [Rhodospirillaceae bacterium]